MSLEIKDECKHKVCVVTGYLVSDDASHVTGCELNISGGLWM